MRLVLRGVYLLALAWMAYGSVVVGALLLRYPLQWDSAIVTLSLGVVLGALAALGLRVFPRHRRLVVGASAVLWLAPLLATLVAALRPVL